VSDLLPVFDEICKRSARFINSCLFSNSPLVRSIAYFAVKNAKFNSFLGSNAAFCCKYFGWDYDNFVVGIVRHNNNFFRDHYWQGSPENDRNRAAAVLELMGLTDGVFDVVFTDNSVLTKDEVNVMLRAVVCD
jgi:hypothetical protein